MKLLGSSAVSRLVEEGKIGANVETQYEGYEEPDLSGPIELDGAGIPEIPE